MVAVGCRQRCSTREHENSDLKTFLAQKQLKLLSGRRKSELVALAKSLNSSKCVLENSATLHQANRLRNSSSSQAEISRASKIGFETEQNCMKIERPSHEEQFVISGVAYSEESNGRHVIIRNSKWPLMDCLRISDATYLDLWQTWNYASYSMNTIPNCQVSWVGIQWQHLTWYFSLP